MKLTALATLAALPASAGCASDDAPEETTVAAPLVVSYAPLWTNNFKVVPMCWDWARNFTSPAEIDDAKAYVWRVIQENWADPLGLIVTWEDCPTEGTARHVRVTLHEGDDNFKGSTAGGLGMFALTPPEQRGDLADPLSQQPGMLLGIPDGWQSNLPQFRALVLHEFGHILGFWHEFSHPDGDAALNDCYDLPPEDGYPLGPPDPESIMGWSYCSDTVTEVSANDLLYARQLYGAAPTHFGAPEQWNAYACPAGMECRLGDVNGDGFADLVVFEHGASARVWIHYASWAPLAYPLPFYFGEPQLGSGYFCTATETCEVGDVNGDGRADLVAFTRGTQHRAWVARSTGSGFTAPYVAADYVCLDGEVCKLADVNGDGAEDFVVFTHGAVPEVWVLPTVRLLWDTIVGAPEQWSAYFCTASETCDVGDLNGDGRADVFAFARGTDLRVWTALSNGGGFGAPFVAGTELCRTGEECRVADADGDGLSDLVAFTHSTTAEVWVARASKSAPTFNPAVRWSAYFCPATETCMVGDVDGDGAADVVAAERSPARIWVGRSSL